MVRFKFTNKELASNPDLGKNYPEIIPNAILNQSKSIQV